MHSRLLGQGAPQHVLLVVHGAQMDGGQPHQRSKKPQHVQQARHPKVGLRPAGHTCTQESKPLYVLSKCFRSPTLPLCRLSVWRKKVRWEILCQALPSYSTLAKSMHGGRSNKAVRLGLPFAHRMLSRMQASAARRVL